MRTGRSILGRFLVFIGLISLVIFFAMDQAVHPTYGFFCVGVLLLVAGGFLLVRGHKPPDESARFRTVRRWREQLRQRKEERKKNPFKY